MPLPDRIRVHALAKLLGVTSKQVLEKLQELGSSARSASSSVVRTEAESVTTALTPPGPEATAAPDAATAVPDAVAVEASPAEVGPTPTSAFSHNATLVDTPTPPVATAFEMPLFLAPPAPEVVAESVEDTSRTRRRRGRRQAGAPLPEQADTATSGSATASSAAPKPDTAKPDTPKSDTPKSDSPKPDTSNPDTSNSDVDGTTDAEAAGHDGDDSGKDGDGSGNRRRRRGRRGRGRGRGGDTDTTADADGSDSDGTESDSAEADSAEADDTASVEAESDGAGTAGDTDENDSEQSATDHAADSEDADGDASTSRRRRRRRRRGSGDPSEGGSESGDDPPNTVVHEREPRSRSKRDEVQGITGSTRLEAKRQRRRDGRDAGRRRPPILSEAEFLARREAVDRKMVVREKMHPDNRTLTQVAVLEDGVLVEHFVTSTASASIVGNVYLGRVQNVLPGMEAAFVDIGRGRNGVLYAGEVDWSSAGLGGNSRRIEQALKPGDSVLVQVSKDPVGHKGARLTTQISLAGRYLVYVPNGGSSGISRKLPDTERKRLKDVLRDVVPADASVIIRTASEGVSGEELARDVGRLQMAWENIKNRADKKENGSGPVSLYEEPDLLVKVVRDLFNEDFAKLVIEGDRSWSTVEQYIQAVAPDMLPRVERYVPSTPDIDVFDVYRIDEQLAKALDRKVWLPSGGTLVIDRTEAMTVVDVNTGKFTGSGGNLEETVTRNNLEAAEEIVRQLRLRDVGGMIVVDFIDMVLESNRDLVLRRLTEALGRDRTRHQVSEVTSLGLVQMTRKRLGTGLIEAFSTPCEHCHGRGLIVHPFPVEAAGEEQRNGSRGDNQSSSRRKRGRKSASSEPSEPATSDATPRKPHPVALAMASRDEVPGEGDQDSSAAVDGGDSTVDTPAVVDVVTEAGAGTTETDATEAVDADVAATYAKVAEIVEASQPDSEADASEEADADKAPQAESDGAAEPEHRPVRARRARRASRPAAASSAHGAVVILPDAGTSAPAAETHVPSNGGSDAHSTARQDSSAPQRQDSSAPSRQDSSAPPRQRRRRAAARPAGPPVDAPAEPGAV